MGGQRWWAIAFLVARLHCLVLYDNIVFLFLTNRYFLSLSLGNETRSPVRVSLSGDTAVWSRDSPYSSAMGSHEELEPFNFFTSLRRL